jgi:N12 class adenine-specific DNA methylase
MPEYLLLDPSEVETDIETLVRQAAQTYGLDPDHLVKMAQQESAFDQSRVSPKGAIGVMQLMPDTAVKEYGIDPNNLEQNIDAGARYYRDLLKRFNNDPVKATAAYNLGPTRVARGDPWPKETRDYVEKITGKSNGTGPQEFDPADVAPIPGLLTPGNIDLASQPAIPNPEKPGKTSTVDSTSFEEDGKEILVPRVTPDGRFLSRKAAEEEYHKTGKHLGIFQDANAATSYAEQLHKDYESGRIKLKPTTRDSFAGNLPTYAESRHTRAPIIFAETKDIPEVDQPGVGLTGYGEPVPEYAKLITDKFPGLKIPKGRGAIYINPAENPDEQRRLVLHETVHNLLDQTLGDPLDPAGSEAIENLYKTMAGKHPEIMGVLAKEGRGVDKLSQLLEAPSYMAAFRPEDVPGITLEQRNAFLADFLGSLGKTHPEAAAKIRKLALPAIPEIPAQAATVEFDPAEVEPVPIPSEAELESKRDHLGVIRLTLTAQGEEALARKAAIEAEAQQIGPDSPPEQLAAFDQKVKLHNLVIAELENAVAQHGADIEDYNTGLGLFNENLQRYADLKVPPGAERTGTPGVPGVEVSIRPEYTIPEGLKRFGKHFVETNITNKYARPMGEPIVRPSLLLPTAEEAQGNPLEGLIAAERGLTGAVEPLTSMESAGMVALGAGATNLLRGVVNLPVAVKLLKGSPVVMKAADVATMAAVPAGFAVLAGNGTILEGDAAWKAAKRGDYIAATEHGAAALGSAAIAALAAAGAVKAGRTAAEAYPVGEIPARGAPRQVRLKTAVEETAALTKSGQRLAAQAWSEQAQKIATEDWGKIFGEDIKLDLNGTAVRIHFEGATTPAGAQGRGRPQWVLIDEATGKRLAAGSAETIRTRIEQRGGAGTPEETATRLDLDYSQAVADRAEAQSIADQARNEGTRDIYAEAVMKEADSRISDIQKQRAKLGREGTQLPQAERPAQAESEAVAPEITKGATFETPSGVTRVLEVKKGRVFFEKEMKAGNKIRGTLGLADFEQQFLAPPVSGDTGQPAVTQPPQKPVTPPQQVAEPPATPSQVSPETEAAEQSYQKAVEFARAATGPVTDKALWTELKIPRHQGAALVRRMKQEGVLDAQGKPQPQGAKPLVSPPAPPVSSTTPAVAPEGKVYQGEIKGEWSPYYRTLQEAQAAGAERIELVTAPTYWKDEPFAPPAKPSAAEPETATEGVEAGRDKAMLQEFRARVEGGRKKLAEAAGKPVPIQTGEKTWLQEAIDRDFELAQRLGIVDEVERLSASELTAKQVAERLGDKLKNVGDAGFEGMDRARLVRVVRNKLGIPSMDDKREFSKWVEDYRQRAAPPAAAGVVTLDPDEVTPVAQEPERKLPRHLSGAMPRYNYGNKSFEIEFASDVDRAAYITAQKTPSKRDADYVAFVAKATGLEEAEVRAYGERVRGAIKEQARDAEPGKLTVERVGFAAKEEGAAGKSAFGAASGEPAVASPPAAAKQEIPSQLGKPAPAGKPRTEPEKPAVKLSDQEISEQLRTRLEKDAAAASARIKEALKRRRGTEGDLASIEEPADTGIPEDLKELWPDLKTVAAHKILAGHHRMGRFTTALSEEFGDWIVPHAQKLYDDASNWIEGETDRMRGVKPEEKEQFDYASTQVNLQGPIAARILAFGETIPDEHLASEAGAKYGGESAAKGRETQPHITIKYGLHGGEPEAVRKLIANEPPVKLKLGKTSIFAGTDNGDVLKVDVESPDLARLNEKIADALPNTETHPGYKPHATIAYLRDGKGKQYTGKEIPGITGQEITLDRIVFSDKSGKQTEIELKGSPAEPAKPAPAPDPVVTHKLPGGGVVQELKSPELRFQKNDHVRWTDKEGKTREGYVSRVEGFTVFIGEEPDQRFGMFRPVHVSRVEKVEEKAKTEAPKQEAAGQGEKPAQPPARPGTSAKTETEPRMASGQPAPEALPAGESTRKETPEAGQYALTGDTYVHRNQIKKLGGRWNGEQKAWIIDADKLPDVQRISRKIVATPHGQPTTETPSAPEAAQLSVIERSIIRNLETNRVTQSGSLEESVASDIENLTRDAFNNGLAQLLRLGLIRRGPEEGGNISFARNPAGTQALKAAQEKKAPEAPATPRPEPGPRRFSQGDTIRWTHASGQEKYGYITSVSETEYRVRAHPAGEGAPDVATQTIEYVPFDARDLRKDTGGPEQSVKAPAKSYRVYVKVKNEWTPNGQFFATKEEADHAGDSLMSRWMAADAAESRLENQAPNYFWDDEEYTAKPLSERKEGVEGKEAGLPSPEAAVEPLVPEAAEPDQITAPESEKKSIMEAEQPDAGDRRTHPRTGTETAGAGRPQRGGGDALRPGGPETLAGVPPEDVRGDGEGESALPPGARGGVSDRGATGQPDAAGPELGEGSRTGRPPVVSPPGGRGAAQPRVDAVEPRSIDGDFRLTPEQAAQAERGGARTKAQNNLAAIRIVKQVQAENRAPTIEEQQAIAKYVGWGDSELANGIFGYKREWAGIREELEGLLTPEEFEAARESTINAHYTRRDLARTMWDAARRLGFRAGGSLLEPGMGSGNFFMMMPEDLTPGTGRTGVEMDLLTGAMARALYPGSNIVIKPYQETNLPDGYFDLVIGNVPFGNVGVNDAAFRRTPYLTENIHNYFIAKSVEKLRPGGVMLVITSRYTMDSKAPAFRRWVNERAELLGAIRLPRDTFLANAGTSVTVDIIALRRRIPEGVPVSDEKWVESRTLDTDDGFKVDVNEYFHRHPEMMMGKMGAGTQYRRGYPELFGEFSLDKLDKMLARLPEGVIPSWEQQPSGARDNLVENYPDAQFMKDGQIAYVDGALVRREGAYFRPLPLKGKKLDRAKALIELRGAAREVIRTQRHEFEEKEILAARKALNRVYDHFVKRHGPVNGNGNSLVFGEDPDWPLLTALEDYNKDTKTATKRAMFRERTIQKPPRITSVETGAEALAVSLNDLGRLDWSRMQELTGRTPEELRQELGGKIYRNPITKSWETRDEYLSGNVRKKLRDAEFAAGEDPQFLPNVEALKAIQPRDLDIGDIDAPLGATWIPDTDYSDFLREVLRVEESEARATDLVKYVPLTGSFAIRPQYTFSDKGVANSVDYGTAYFSGMELLEFAINGKMPVARDEEVGYTAGGYPTTVMVKNAEATIEAVEKQRALVDQFSKWLWSDSKRANRLKGKYNEERNNLKLREFDGSHQTFPGLNRTWLRNQDPDPHQKTAVWRTIQSGNTLYAHVVGSGKTLEITMAAMELRRLGLARKPMITVPNHLVGQWKDAFLLAYPGAQILVPTKKDFDKQNRRKLMSRIATGNYDAVIVGHTHFQLLAVKDETFKEFMDAQVAELEAAIETFSKGKQKGEAGRDPTVKQLVRRKKQLEAKIEKRTKREKKDTGVTFEELGVDWLFVDEADLFKNLGYLTMMDRVAGLPNSDADRATDMLLKTRYVSQLHGGDRGLVFATGTPVSNSIAEIWTMMRYLIPQYLEREGLDQFDAWAKTFGKVRTQMEVAPEGGRFISRSRFAEFHNAPELMNMFRLAADIQTAEKLNLPTPAVYQGGPIDVVAPASAAQKAYVLEIGKRADDIRNGVIKDPSIDNMLKLSSDGRKASLDMRLVDPLAEEEPVSKVAKAIDNIVAINKEFGQYRAAQLVFLDLSTPKSEKVTRAKPAAAEEVANVADQEETLYDEKEEEVTEEVVTTDEQREIFTVYGQIRQKLIARGFKPEQVAFIHDAKTDIQKLLLYERVNRGDVRVLIGSTEKMGAGMNVQERLIANHHLDAPWRPRDIEQRDGRIKRQGNKLWDEHKIPVRIYRYMTEGTFDAFMWETVSAKAKPIQQFMNGDPAVRRIEELSPAVMSYEQAKAVSSGNPLVREKIILDQEVLKAEIMRGTWLTEQATISQTLATLPEETKAARQRVENFTTDIAARNSDSALVIDGKRYEEKEIRAEGAPILIERLKKVGVITEPQSIETTYHGIPLEATPHFAELGVRHSKTDQSVGANLLFAREMTPDNKWLYYQVTAQGFQQNWHDIHKRDAFGLKELDLSRATQVHVEWDKMESRFELKYFSAPQLRLRAASGTYRVSVNYDANPAGTIASADNHLRGFEESLQHGKDQLRRLEKQQVELESRLGQPFKGEEKLRTMLRRQQELSDQLGAEANDRQALGADEEQEANRRDPLRPMRLDPTTSMHADWFPSRRIFAASDYGKYPVQVRVVGKYLGVREVTKGKSYEVIHLPSGKRMGNFFHQDYHAVAFARQAEASLDWNWAVMPKGFKEKFERFQEKFEAPDETPEESLERLRAKVDATQNPPAENPPQGDLASLEEDSLPEHPPTYYPQFEKLAAADPKLFLHDQTEPRFLWADQNALNLLKAVLPKHQQTWAGMHFTTTSVLRMVDTLRQVAPNVSPEARAKIEAIAAELEAGVSDFRPLLIVGHRPGDSWQRLRERIKHERFHWFQTQEAGGEGKAGVEHIDAESFLQDQLARRALRGLTETGYPRITSEYEMHAMAAEIGAHLAQGPRGWARMGISRDEAKQLFSRYLDYLIERHGGEIVSRLPRIASQLNGVLDETRTKAAEARRQGYQPGYAPGAREAPGELLGGVRQGVPARGSQAADLPATQAVAPRRGTAGFWVTPEGEVIPLGAEAEHQNLSRFRGKNKDQLLRSGYIRTRGNGIEIQGLEAVDPSRLRQAVERAAKGADSLYVDTAARSMVYDTEDLEANDWSLRKVRPVESFWRGEAGDMDLASIGEWLSERFGEESAEVNYGGLRGVFGPLETRYRRNLGQTRRASARVHREALRTASSNAKSRVILRAAVPTILDALKGSDFTWPELRLALIESRLRGIRERWERFAEQISTMEDTQLQEVFKEEFAGLLSAIQGKRGIPQDVVETAAALDEAADWDTLREFLGQTFSDAAANVAEVMEPRWYDRVTSDPQVQDALRAYKRLVEAPMAQNHALNEGVFSDSLGPLDTYYPLIPFDRNPGFFGSRVTYKKPKNAANKFATGLAEGYDVGMEAFQERLSRAIRANDRAALLKVLEEEGLLQPAEQGQDTIVWNGVEYTGVQVPVSEARTLIKDKKTIPLKTRMDILPAWLHRELKPILEHQPHSADPSRKIVRTLNTLSLIGPLDMVFHARNVLGALVSNTPFLGPTLADKAVSVPLVKSLAVVWKVLLQTDPTTPENLEKLLEVADIGGVPSKYGSQTYSRKYAEATGATLKHFPLTLGPMLYGPKGLDARARIVMWDIAKALFPEESQAGERSLFVNQLGNYTPELWSEIERALKEWGIAPFFTAGSTALANGVNAWTGLGPMPKGWRALRLMYLLTAGALGLLAFWVIASKLLTGKYPTEDRRAKLFQLPVGGGNGPLDKYRYSKLGRALWGDGPETGYLSFNAFNPLVGRGARALGLTGAFETRQLGGNFGQQLEAAQRDSLNALVHPGLGPVPRSVFTGVFLKETYLTSFRDQAGRLNPQFFPSVDPNTPAGWPTMGARMRAAGMELNSFFGDVGQTLGESTGFLDPAEKYSQGNKYLRQSLDLFAPGLVARASNQDRRAKALERQRTTKRKTFGTPAFKPAAGF